MKKYIFYFILLLPQLHAATTLPQKPNIIVILTDQERYPTHWPENWVEKNLPSQMRLKKQGAYFSSSIYCGV